MSQMRANSRRRQRQSGVAIILLTLMLMSVLLPMVALAIDVTMLYVVKAKLQGAVDGAVLAAGRSITGAVTLAAQTPRLQNIAQQFLNANLPQGYWGATTPQIEGSGCSTGAGCVNVIQNSTDKRIYISITASVQVPLLFARTIWNKQTNSFNTTSTVRVTGQAMRRWVRLVLVLDRSNSMAGAPGTALKTAVTNSDPSQGFVINFDEARDQMGMVVFGGTALVAYPPRDPTIANGGGTGPDGHFKTGSPNILNQVNSYLSFGSATGTAEALVLAYKELTKNPQPLYLNAIVFFTDGMPSSFTASYNGNPAVSLYAGDTASTGSANVVKNAGCTNWNTPANPIIGWMTQTANFANSNSAEGIFPLMQKTWYTGSPAALSTDVNNWLSNPDHETAAVTQVNSNNCKFRTDSTWTGSTNADLSSFPTEDLYGNKTNTIDYQDSLLYHNTSSIGLNMTSVNNAYQIGLVSWNTAYNAAKRIRGDTNLKPTIYCIGYNGAQNLDRGLMKRMANTNEGFQTWAQDPQGQYLVSDYDPSSTTTTTGKYFEASTTGSIAQAFQQVQSEILRLSM
jgi:Flp pilus assembly protein TadG